MFTSLLFKGGIVLVLVTACLFFAWRIVRILNPRPLRPPKYAEYFVVEVRNGATIIVAKKMGKRGSRRTKSLNLEGIASPAEGEEWFAESRDNLKLFAGAKVRVQVRGLFRSEKSDDDFDSEWNAWFGIHKKDCSQCSGGPSDPICEEAFEKLKEMLEKPDDKLKDMVWTSPIAKAWVLGGGSIEAIPDDEAFARDVAAFAILNLRECLVCAESQEYPCQCWLDRDDVFWEWYAWHLSRQRCTVCCDAWLLAIAEYNKNDPEARAEVLCLLCEGHGKIICFPDMLHREEYEVVCFRCGGDGKVYRMLDSLELEARDVVVGTVWGESGALLNLEQLKSGWAKSVGKVPEEWAEAEKAAKKTNTGIWGEGLSSENPKGLESRVFALELAIELAIRALENGQKRGCLKLLRDALDAG